jgi:hypothetical protein
VVTAIARDAAISDGVLLDPSIFDDRSYVEVDADWLARAEIEMKRRSQLEAETFNTAVARN